MSTTIRLVCSKAPAGGAFCGLAPGGGQMETIFERVGALDVHKAQVTACVRVPDSAGGREPRLAAFATSGSVMPATLPAGGRHRPSAQTGLAHWSLHNQCLPGRDGGVSQRG